MVDDSSMIENLFFLVSGSSRAALRLSTGALEPYALWDLAEKERESKRSLVGVRLLPINIPIAIGFFVVIALLLELRLVESCEIKKNRIVRLS